MTNKYSELSQQEKEILSAKINHAISKSFGCYDAVEKLVKKAERLGLFEGVKFGHEEVYNQPQKITTGHYN